MIDKSNHFLPFLLENCVYFVTYLAIVARTVILGLRQVRIMTVLEKIKLLTKQRGISIVRMEEDLGLGKNTAYRWNNKTPNPETLEKLADYFHVSVDYLLDREDGISWVSESDFLDLEEMLNSNIDMAFGGDKLTEEQKRRVKDIVTTLFWEEKKNEDNK